MVAVDSCKRPTLARTNGRNEGEQQVEDTRMRKKLVLRPVVLELNFRAEGQRSPRGRSPLLRPTLSKKAIQSG